MDQRSRLEDAADVVEITQNLYRYHHTIDAKQWDALREVFVADVRCSWAGLGSMLGLDTDAPEGVDAVVAWLVAASGPRGTVHHMLNTVVDLDGDRATSTSHVGIRAGAAGEVVDAGTYRGGHVRTADGWRIRSLVFTHRMGGAQMEATAAARRARAVGERAGA